MWTALGMTHLRCFTSMFLSCVRYRIRSDTPFILHEQWHPDRHPDATRPEAEKRFKLISEAYQTLSTASGRSTYDMRSSSSSSSSSRGAGAPEWGSARQGFGGFQQPPGGGPQRDWGYARAHRSPPSTPERDFVDIGFGLTIRHSCYLAWSSAPEVEP